MKNGKQTGAMKSKPIENAPQLAQMVKKSGGSKKKK